MTELTAALFEGIRRITIHYSGGGDSGCMDSMEAYDAESERVLLSAAQKTAAEGRWQALIDDLPDWYNNDGGYGTATVDLQENTINYDHHQYDSRGESGHRSRYQLPEPVITALKELPEIVYRVLFDHNEQGDSSIVCLDSDGRRVIVDLVLTEELREQLAAATCHGRLSPGGPGGDPQDESGSWAMVVDVRTGTAEVTINWTEQDDQGSDYSFAFIDGGEAADE